MPARIGWLSYSREGAQKVFLLLETSALASSTIDLTISWRWNFLVMWTFLCGVIGIRLRLPASASFRSLVIQRREDPMNGLIYSFLLHEYLHFYSLCIHVHSLFNVYHQTTSFHPTIMYTHTIQTRDTTKLPPRPIIEHRSRFPMHNRRSSLYTRVLISAIEQIRTCLPDPDGYL